MCTRNFRVYSQGVLTITGLISSLDYTKLPALLHVTSHTMRFQIKVMCTINPYLQALPLACSP